MRRRKQRKKDKMFEEEKVKIEHNLAYIIR
jgi:hypothetical protein